MKILAGRYRLEEPTGHGGMAVVHRAYDTVLRRTVAIKTLPPERCWDSVFRAAVQREARAAAQLCHPNIAAVYDYGEATFAGTTQPFVVLEFVTGGTLADHLRSKGPLPCREAAGICAGVAAGLAAAHAHQLVHRDIKPANVMLSPAGVKVVDFGVAIMAGQAAADDDGRMWGTPAYLAPEQLRHDTVSPAADVYAVGLLVHVCLTGRPPWPGDNATQVLTARRRQPTPNLHHLPGLPEQLRQLLRDCLALAPDSRPSARRVARVLREVAAAEGDVPVHAGDAAPTGTATTVMMGASPRKIRRAVTAVMIPAAVTGAVLTGRLLAAGPTEPVAGRGAPDSIAGCAVSYTSHRDADGSLAARLDVANTGDQLVPGGGIVSFTIPDGVRITHASASDWSQQQGIVRLSTPDLRPGAHARFVLRGTFDPAQSEPPAGFALAGNTCGRAATAVNVATGAPAKSSTSGRRASEGTRSTPRNVARETTVTQRDASPAPVATSGSPTPTQRASEPATVPATPSASSPSRPAPSEPSSDPSPGPSPSASPSRQPEPTSTHTNPPPAGGDNPAPTGSTPAKPDPSSTIVTKLP
ncbi:serine/threonine-protein kinase [Paractinoplanes rishiriensis]|uniref:non-specific serine/threonine protein kinase n=1 Tax=Paractinoplanes rishiriensis TaxID=1050105 RepID=A0A919MZA3_9ACTN|nr:serine/threonine-protein kinase [Actinoplanes rishiriensis]GIF01259.1 hypothetical protein Ari01nite_87230 [Actinoplanes rishiriensis]